VSCTCNLVAWAISQIASTAFLINGQSTPASCETSTQWISIRLLALQPMESIEVVLLRLLAVDLVVLGNSGKPVTLETLSLTKFLRHVFQGQESHDFRKPGTCEASNSRMCAVRES
jgi:hypothetical protein